ncbi:MAG: DUF4271 domain-containing protein [Cytophagales bacterium]|nr:MAG: DUF4271 domain-containing protein [Cytophagales bacterium]
MGLFFDILKCFVNLCKNSVFSYLRYCFFLLFCFGVVDFQLLAKSPRVREQLIIYSIENEWSIYDNKLQTYIPFLPTLQKEEKQLYLVLTNQKYTQFYLSILGKKDTYLFINNNLSYYFRESSVLHLKIDSLQKMMKSTSLLFTYLSESSILKPPLTQITQQKIVGGEDSLATHKKTETLPNSGILVRERASEAKTNKNFLLIASLGLLTIMAVFSYTSKPIFSFQFIFSELDSFLKGKNQIKRLSTPSFLFFLLYYSAALAFAIMFLSTYSSKLSYAAFLIIPNTLGERVEAFLLLTGIIILLVAIKYFLIWILGSLYNDRSIVNLHFQEYMTISQLFCVVWLSVILLANSIATTISQDSIDYLLYFFAFCMLLQSVLMSYRINNSTIHKKLYLFAYLCASEYLPLFLSAKLLIVS